MRLARLPTFLRICLKATAGLVVQAPRLLSLTSLPPTEQEGDGGQPAGQDGYVEPTFMSTLKLHELDAMQVRAYRKPQSMPLSIEMEEVYPVTQSQ